MTPYIIFRLIVAVVVATICYIVDRRGGTSIYRWWYGMTHEHPLSINTHLGFVHNRQTRNRVIAATVLSSLISIPAIMYGPLNALVELILWLVTIPVMVITFMAGPKLSALWGKREGVYTAVDKWERGEVDLSDNLKVKSQEIAADIKKMVTPVQDIKPVTEPDEKPGEAPLPANPDDEPDPQELVNRFIHRGE